MDEAKVLHCPLSDDTLRIVRCGVYNEGITGAGWIARMPWP
jgi:hypothetical protein